MGVAQTVTLELRRVASAVTFYTRVPLPQGWTVDLSDLGATARHLPLVGLLVGGASALTYLGALRIWGADLAVALALGVGVAMTGVFHEDGLADATDGLGGAWTKEDALRIMKDSRIGTYGTVALLFCLGLKFLALRQLPGAILPAALLLGHTASRLTALTFMTTHHYVREAGKAAPATTVLTPGSLLAAAVPGLAPLALLPLPAAWVLVPLLGVRVYFARLLTRKLGGYTGDCLGAVQQVAEAAIYLTLAGLPWTST